MTPRRKSSLIRALQRYIVSLLPALILIGALIVVLVKLDVGTTVVAVMAIMLSGGVTPLFSSILTNLYDMAELAGEGTFKEGVRVVVTGPDGVTNGAIVAELARAFVVQRDDGSKLVVPVALMFTSAVVVDAVKPTVPPTPPVPAPRLSP